MTYVTRFENGIILRESTFNFNNAIAHASLVHGLQLCKAGYLRRGGVISGRVCLILCGYLVYSVTLNYSSCN